MGIFKEAYYVGVVAWRGMFPRGDFKANNVPDLAGRVTIVTGTSISSRLPAECSVLSARIARRRKCRDRAGDDQGEPALGTGWRVAGLHARS